MRICILIPAHNESKNIGRLVHEIRDKGLDVLVIDDGSQDDTASQAKAQGATVLVNHPRQGKGASLKRGFQYLLEQGFEGIITMDGDGQHDVGDLDQFIAEAHKNPQSLINGSRMHHPEGMPWIRRLTNRFMSWMISMISGQRIEDTQCGFRYVSCDTLRNINLISNDFEIETEVLLKSSKAGTRIFSVPIKTIYRDEVSKIRPIKDTCRFFCYLFRELLSQPRGHK